MSQHRYDIPNRREVISRKAVMAELDMAAMTNNAEKARAKLLKLLKDALSKGQAEIRERLYSDKVPGLRCAHAYAYLTDQIIRLLYDFTVRNVYPLANPTASERIAIVATGGYGRGEMAPYSDVDLMILVPYKAAPWVENVAEFMLYILWDLGLKVGHSIRSTEDAIKYSNQDLTVCTSLLDARFIWGDLELFSQFQQSFREKVIAKRQEEFVEDKLMERQLRHERVGDARYVVEPNLKEGKGGLRDLQTIFWIARFLFGTERISGLIAKEVMSKEDVTLYQKAEDFFWTVRCHLHLLSGRATELLSFDIQTELSKALKYRDHPGLSGVERFMKHYFLMTKRVGDLTRVICADLEERQKKKSMAPKARKNRLKPLGDFVVDGGRLSVKDPDDFAQDPVKMIEIFALAEENGYDIHPDALRAMSPNLRRIGPKVQRDPRACALFLKVLCSPKTPEVNLRRMNEAGVFGRFIPDFGRVVAQMQHDMYHHYTVDEHTIRAIGLLSQLEKGLLVDEHPTASKVVKQLASRRALYVAVFLHDIAKGRGGDHSVLGAEVAEKLCPRLGLSSAETEVVAWLVRYHLLFSNTAFKRDIGDPETITQFVNLIQSPERLRMLLVLTVVDIRAVGPGVWNAWKQQLISSLYYAAEEQLVAGHVGVGRKQRLLHQQDAWRARMTDWSDEHCQQFMKRFSAGYWLSEDVQSLVENAHLVERAEKENLSFAVDINVKSAKGATTVRVYAKSRPGLFSNLAGALAQLGANIMDAKIHSTDDGIALDSFAIQDHQHKAFTSKTKLNQLRQTLQDWAEGRGKRSEAVAERVMVPSRQKVFKVAPFVIFDNKISRRHTLIEINARDRQGLLYDLTQVLFNNKVEVISAHVATYGERAVDVFYVQEKDGRKVTHYKRLQSLREKLAAATKAT